VQNQTEDRARRRTEREPDADLLHPLPDQMGQDAVKAARGEQQAQPGQDGE
jgi:hypothetical protein